MPIKPPSIELTILPINTVYFDRIQTNYDIGMETLNFLQQDIVVIGRRIHRYYTVNYLLYIMYYTLWRWRRQTKHI